MMKLKNTEEAIPVFHEALASFEENNCLIEVGKTCYLYSQCLENSTAIIYLKRSLSALVESLGKEDPFTLEVLQKPQVCHLVELSCAGINSDQHFLISVLGEKVPIFYLDSKILSSRSQFLAKLQLQRLSDILLLSSVQLIK